MEENFTGGAKAELAPGALAATSRANKHYQVGAGSTLRIERKAGGAKPRAHPSKGRAPPLQPVAEQKENEDSSNRGPTSVEFLKARPSRKRKIALSSYKSISSSNLPSSYEAIHNPHLRNGFFKKREEAPKQTRSRVQSKAFVRQTSIGMAQSLVLAPKPAADEKPRGGPALRRSVVEFRKDLQRQKKTVSKTQVGVVRQSTVRRETVQQRPHSKKKIKL